MDRVAVIFDLLTEMPPELAREHHFEQQPTFLWITKHTPEPNYRPQEPPPDYCRRQDSDVYQRRLRP